MAYNDPEFSFNPNKNFTFDPSKKQINGQSDNPIGVDSNPYIQTCDDNSILAKEAYRQQVDEYAQTFGMTVSYQPIIYNFNTHNFLYGEDPTSGFRYARKVKAIVDLTTYTTFITQYGMMSDADITIYISIRKFKEAWGNIVPLAGDLFIIDDSACDRPLRQSPMVFQVTDKQDHVNPVDYMGGHYVWKITAKRFDYSHEPNAPEEKFLDSASDTKEYGLVDSETQDENLHRQDYEQNVDDFAEKEFKQPKTSVYGNYL